MQPTIQPAKPQLSRDELTCLWSKLGIAYATPPINVPVDPERTLLCSLEHASHQRKTLKLVAAWLSTYGDLIHVERVVCLMRNGTWLDDSAEMRPARTLAAFADRLVEQGDRRWNAVITEAKRTLGESPAQLPASEDEVFLIGRDGTDAHFYKFGISTSSLMLGSDVTDQSVNKKIRLREHVLKENPWLRLRSAVGTNWRADVLFIILAGLAKNPFQASRTLGCSYETAHRIWNAAAAAKVKELFQTDPWGERQGPPSEP